MADINVGVLAEQINSKADIDLRNIDTTKCDMVIEYQEPTEENNYTWYRLYATGWIEQGGIDEGYTQGGGASRTISLLIPMQDNFYNICCQKTTTNDSGQMSIQTFDLTPSEFKWSVNYGAAQQSREIRWQVSGKVDPSVMLNHEILPSKAKNEEFEHRVIAFQKPTADNNYTWYRKYADGWVEQGGYVVSNGNADQHITLLIEMNSDTYYVSTKSKSSATTRPNDTTAANRNTSFFYDKIVYNQTTTGFNIGSTTEMSIVGTYWRVEGMTAE